MKKIVLTILFLSFISQISAQFFKDNKTVKKYEGYFTFYYDESKDKLFLEVEKLDQEFLYVHSL